MKLKLDLSNNRLTSLSPEFTRFRGLKELYIGGNALITTGIPDHVVRQLLQHNDITSIGIGSYELLKKVLKYKRNTIENLYLDGMTETRFEPGIIVKGDNSTLKLLQVDSCMFEDFSELLCNVDIENFRVLRCRHVHDTTLQGCQQNITTGLSILDCGTTDALDPSAFYSAPVTSFQLSGRQNQHVPSSMLKHWPNITSIDIAYTQIQRIEKEDFEGFAELQVLYLSDNHNINFVDDEAFNTNLKLERLYLQSATLDHPPYSIKNLTHLMDMVLPEMTCSCSTMGALKGGNYSSARGYCKNGYPYQSIREYLQNDLNSCP